MKLAHLEEAATTLATAERPTPELVAGALETAASVAGRRTRPADVKVYEVLCAAASAVRRLDLGGRHGPQA